MENIIIIVVVALIVGLAGFYIYRSKKSGKTCIGCPYGGCSSENGTSCSCCGCGAAEEESEAE